MKTIRTIDQTTGWSKVDGPTLQLESGPLTVRELIAWRVREEVRSYNSQPTGRYNGLVQPTDLEEMLNGPVERKFKWIDPDLQVEVALKAFREQRVFLILPTGQATDLDQLVELTDGDCISFLRLVPLIGG